jgi:integrase
VTSPSGIGFFVLNQRRYIEVRKTEFFTPKGKRRRILPLEEILWQALQEVRQENPQFVVPGNAPLKYTRENTPKNIPYRCERALRVLVEWLRKKGINDLRPCCARNSAHTWPLLLVVCSATFARPFLSVSNRGFLCWAHGLA